MVIAIRYVECPKHPLLPRRVGSIGPRLAVRHHPENPPCTDDSVRRHFSYDRAIGDVEIARRIHDDIDRRDQLRLRREAAIAMQASPDHRVDDQRADGLAGSVASNDDSLLWLRRDFFCQSIGLTAIALRDFPKDAGTTTLRDVLTNLPRMRFSLAVFTVNN